ncbi:MAG TPA: FGGY family carbohydrate kinase, partial [Acidimicrobiales bacterium]|nr:FGGY family carbohydrate kinase [Acidimicrobiales bacterium]
MAGVDSSTQSSKVVVCDAEDGTVIATGTAPHPPVSPPRSEQDPQAWWDALWRAWEAAGSPKVAALSVAGQQHGLVALDDGGHPLHPAKLWNDTESAPQAAELVAALGADAWAAACGSVPTASFTITKLA